MREPRFWWREGSLLGQALAPLGALYGAVTARRMARGGVRPGVPVICIGNFQLGGAGKTPTAMAVATLLHARRGRSGSILFITARPRSATNRCCLRARRR
jgi:tetraacyldisaccharide 4'-kinase